MNIHNNKTGIRDMQAVRNIQKVDPRWVDPTVFEGARCISMHARVDIRLLYNQIDFGVWLDLMCIKYDLRCIYDTGSG